MYNTLEVRVKNDSFISFNDCKVFSDSFLEPKQLSKKSFQPFKLANVFDKT